MDEVTKQLSTANTELKAFIRAKLALHPALAPLDDPVYVQLAAYAIICAPLLLLFLPVLLWLATCLAPSPKVWRGRGGLPAWHPHPRWELRGHSGVLDWAQLVLWGSRRLSYPLFFNSLPPYIVQSGDVSKSSKKKKKDVVKPAKAVHKPKA